jgi:hypothetical protein
MQNTRATDTSLPDGRLAAEQSPTSLTLHIRVPSELLAQVDRLVSTRYLGRGEAVRSLSNAGLKSEVARDG